MNLASARRSLGAPRYTAAAQKRRGRHMPKPKPTSVSEYIEAAPKGAQKQLRDIRSVLKKVAPGATETLKWGSPVLSLSRRNWRSTKKAETRCNALTTNHSRRRSFERLRPKHSCRPRRDGTYAPELAAHPSMITVSNQ